MMNLQTWAFRIQSVLAYAATARSRYFLHSPFVFDFYEKVLLNKYYKNELTELKPIEKLRADLARQVQALVRYQTLPDGQLQQLPPQPLNQILRRESCTRPLGEFLFRFSRHYRPARVLELGVNLGLAALYLKAGHPEAHYMGIEGNPELARLALRHIQQLDFSGQVVESSFSDFLNDLPDEPVFDLIYLDGDHRGVALLEYCSRLLPLLRAGGCLVIDDIRWNRELNRAWRACCQLEVVSVSVELLRIGLLFAGREQAREHFVLWSPHGV